MRTISKPYKSADIPILNIRKSGISSWGPILSLRTAQRLRTVGEETKTHRDSKISAFQYLEIIEDSGSVRRKSTTQWQTNSPAICRINESRPFPLISGSGQEQFDPSKSMPVEFPSPTGEREREREGTPISCWRALLSSLFLSSAWRANARLVFPLGGNATSATALRLRTRGIWYVPTLINMRTGLEIGWAGLLSLLVQSTQKRTIAATYFSLLCRRELSLAAGVGAAEEGARMASEMEELVDFLSSPSPSVSSIALKLPPFRLVTAFKTDRAQLELRFPLTAALRTILSNGLW